MKKYFFIVLFLTFSFGIQLFAQSDWLTSKALKSPDRKHQLWIMWGYNRAGFSNSDIQFTGPGYDFTLLDVVAKDRQSPFDANVYFNPRWWTVPQYNIRAGYFLSERFCLSFGHDHMKYVMVNDQVSTISGSIDSSASSNYAGTYDNNSITLSREFLRFEHTNGLNYVSVEGDFYGNLWKSSNNKRQLDYFIGGGIGALYPRSDVDLFDVEGVNVFHVAGWGTALETGIRFDFIPQVYLLLCLKAGYINMPNVLTVTDGHKAQQSFWFLQRFASIGFNTSVFQKKMKDVERKDSF